MSVSIPCVPVCPSRKAKYTVSFVELLDVAVIFVAVVAVSALPVSAPSKVVVWRTSVLGL